MDATTTSNAATPQG